MAQFVYDDKLAPVEYHHTATIFWEVIPVMDVGDHEARYSNSVYWDGKVFRGRMYISRERWIHLKAEQENKTTRLRETNSEEVISQIVAHYG